MGPGGRCASASHITDNKVVVFPPDRLMKEAKSNGLQAGSCCNMGCPICGSFSREHLHHLQDPQVAMEASPHHLKVSILATEAELDAEHI